MASNRHLGRIISLQSLYEYEFRSKAGDASVDVDTIIAKNIEPYEKALGDTEFVYKLTHGVVDAAKELDEFLTPIAPEWPIADIAAIDRNVLRMGVYELEQKEVPPKVAINEAVELAKAFGSESSSRFVNGVLGTAFKKLGLGEETSSEGNNDHHEEKSAEAAAEPAQPAESTQSADQPAPSEEDTQPESAATDATDHDQPAAD